MITKSPRRWFGKILVTTFSLVGTITCIAGELGEAQRVIDGDTLYIGKQRHRLQGIDAPESEQHCLNSDGSLWPCGQKATIALRNRIGAKQVICTSSGNDRYGRFLSTCHAGENNLNRWMVLNGWAVAYRKYSLEFVHEENTAKRNRVGLWSGGFVMPWEWRRGARLDNSSLIDKRKLRHEL